MTSSICSTHACRSNTLSGSSGPSGSPMALKFFPRESTRLLSFLQEYNFSLSFCSHPSLTRALGIVYSTPSHYIFAQQASLFGDLYDLIQPEVNPCSINVLPCSSVHFLTFVYCPGWPGGGAVSASSVPALWGLVSSTFAGFCPQRRKTREHFPV